MMSGTKRGGRISMSSPISRTELTVAIGFGHAAQNLGHGLRRAPAGDVEGIPARRAVDERVEGLLELDDRIRADIPVHPVPDLVAALHLGALGQRAAVDAVAEPDHAPAQLVGLDDEAV